MERKFKIVLFVFLFALLWLPLIQEQTKWFTEPQLRGAFVKPAKPEFSLDSLSELKFQKKYEEYINADFGFRGLLVKSKNSLNHILFNELSVVDDIEGKDGLIFKISSIEQALGILYGPEEKYQQTLERIKFLKEGVENHGGHFLAIITPTKEKILPDFMPEHYRDKYRLPNEYNTFIEGFKREKIPFIDFTPYLKTMRDTSKYPVFNKTGVHWSMYAASFAQDSLLSYISKSLSKELPEYKRTGIEVSDTARESDNDFEPPLNLFYNIGQLKYFYPKLEMIASTTKNYRPKVIVIGDSFFWQLKAQRMLKNIFSEDSKFWFYFSNTSYPIGDVGGEPMSSIDRKKELETADYVIIMGNISTLDYFPYGVENYYYDSIAKPWLAESVKEYLKNSANSDYEAKRICRDKKTITITAANGKYVCAGGLEEKILVANRDKAADWEKFTLLQFGGDKVAIYSYKNLFLSVVPNNKAEIISAETRIGSSEIFTMVKPDNDFVVFKAANGKYLSLEVKSKQLFARGNSIGENEKFKLTVLK